MKILVANVGSTSFKYKLFDMTDETVLAEGRLERIGDARCPFSIASTARKPDPPARFPIILLRSVT